MAEEDRGYRPGGSSAGQAIHILPVTFQHKETYVEKREGQRGRSGMGTIFTYKGVDYDRKMTKRTKAGSFYLQCKHKNCTAKLIIGADY